MHLGMLVQPANCGLREKFWWFKGNFFGNHFTIMKWHKLIENLHLILYMTLHCTWLDGLVVSMLNWHANGTWFESRWGWCFFFLFCINISYLRSEVRIQAETFLFFLLKSLFFLLQLIQYSQIFTRFWLINWYVHKSHSIWLSFKCGYLIGPRSTVLAIYARLKTLFDLLYACTRYFLPNWSDFYPKSSSPIEWAHCDLSVHR